MEKAPFPSLTASFNSLFVRQEDGFSCGVACLATIAKLYEIPEVDYTLLRQLLAPQPQEGISNKKMIDISKTYLPFESAGENCYTGGIAIANITEDEGHFVLFLCRENDRVIYYDPYEHKLIESRLSDINWVSETERLKNWAINFQPVQDNSIAQWRRFCP